MDTKKKAETAAGTAEKTEKPAPVRNKKPQEPVMYVGPTIAGIAIQNRIYTEIPAGAQAAFGELPDLRNLFLPVRDYPIANQMLRDKKGFVYSAFVKALTLKGGNKT